MRHRLQFAALAVVVGIVGGVLVAGPASAESPKPPPVTPYADLPSRTANYYNPNHLTPGSPAYDDWLAAMRAKVPPPVNGALPQSVAAGKPLTAPAALSRGAAGGVLTAGFVMGWGIGTAGLEAYGQVTGTDFDAAMCSYAAGGGGALIAAHTVANFGLGPTCGATVNPTKVNDDQAVETALVHGGTALAIYKGTGQSGAFCYSRADTIPAGTVVEAGHPSYSWTILGFDGSPCYMYSAASGHHLAWSGGYVAGWYIRLRSGSTIVAVSSSVKPNPVRQVGCTIDWEDGTTTTGVGSTYDEETGRIPTSGAGTGCKPAWANKSGAGSGLLPSRIRVSSTAPGGSPVVISDQTVPAHTTEQRAALAAPATAGLVLTKTISGVTDSCMTWAADCAGWWAATSSGTVATTGTTTYTCTFGGVSVALAECGVYRTTFDVQTANPVVTDPVTGDVVSWVPGSTTGDPQNSLDPSVGPTPGDDCMAEWPSAPDPISWVLHPVKCALVWAFVPRQSVVDAGFEALEGRWESTAMGGLAAAVAGWSFVAPSSSGCDGITVGISTLGHGIDDFQILNACAGEPLQPLAGLSTVVIGLGAILGAIGAVTGSIGGIVGMRRLGGGDAA